MKEHKDCIEQFEEFAEAESDNRERWLEDLKFGFSDDQWPEKLKRFRQNDPNGPRPCLTVNKIPAHARQILNDMRQARASIKVLPVDDDADIETAEIYQGLIRHIEHVSNADQAYSIATEYQVMMGVGYWRVTTEVVDPIYNEQEIRILPIRNPFGVYMDPWITDITGGDAQACFVATNMPKKAFERSYPKADIVDVKGDRPAGWFTNNSVRVCEAFYLEDYEEDYVIVGGRPYKADKYDISMGKVDREAKSKKKRLYWKKFTGKEILEEREMLGQYIPIIRVAGEDIDIDGERIVHGIVRRARDAQQMYNFTVSAIAERNALEPKAPWLVADESIDGHEDEFGRANVSNSPFLRYKAFTDEGQQIPPPQRQFPTGANSALLQQMASSDGDIQATIGQFAASLGEVTNEKSGKAIQQRQIVGDIATFHYPDNLGRAIRQCGRVIVDLIPQIYDTERVARIIGEDGEAEQVRITPKIKSAMEERPGIGKIYNLGVGKYDVAVSVGPSYATKRQEAAEAMTQVMQGNPQLMGVIGDLYFKALDVPESDEIAKRIKATIPSEIRQDEEEDGAPLPPDVVAKLQEMEAAIGEREAALQEAGAQLQDMQQTIDGKVIEAQAKEREAEIKAATLAQKEQESLRNHELRIAELSLQEAAQILETEKFRAELIARQEAQDMDKADAQAISQTQSETAQMLNALAKHSMQQSELLAAILQEMSKPKGLSIQTDSAGNIVGGVSQTIN